MNDPTTTRPAGASLHARRRSLFWRIHFWAALIASPFTLVATLTGIVYIFTPQIEASLYGGLEHVTPAGARLPLDAAVAAARGALPAGFDVSAVTPPDAADDAVRVTIGPAARTAAAGEHAGHGAAAAGAMAGMAGMAMPAALGVTGPTAPGSSAATPAPTAAATVAAVPASTPTGTRTVYVDPYRARVLGVQDDAARFGDWARRLHSQLLQGEGARWMIELAASWLLVMLLTGIYLWWPRPGQSARALLPRAGVRGRAWWRQWHAFLGVLLAVLSLAMVVTGITWSRYAGEQVRALRDWSGQAPPPPPAHLHSMPTGAAPLTWQQAWTRVQALAPGAVQLKPPRGPHGVWRAASSAKADPVGHVDLVLNAYDGRVLYRAGWSQETAFGQATAVGIPFHRGELGLWNQALLLVFAAGILFSLLSGWAMFFKRRRAGALGLPRLLPGAWRAAPPAAIVLGLALCALLPLLAASALVLAAIETGLARRDRAGAPA